MNKDGQAAGASQWRIPFSNLAAKLQQRMQEREDQVFLILALVIGAITGLVVVAFIATTERISLRLYPIHGEHWRALVFPIIGSLGVGYLLYRYFPNARGSGVPQTKAALYANNGVITLRTVLGKFFCTSATLASGIPLGREGPSVQVAAGIASVLGRRLGMRPERVKALIPVGAAAAIAAAFNTPLAAVVFSLEEIVGDMNAPVLGAVVIASATAWIVLRLILGNHPLFAVPQYQLTSSIELAFYAVLGVAGGLLSAGFSKMLLGIRQQFLRFPRRTVWFQPVAGGLLVGVMGWFVPQVMGVGYTFVGDVLNGRMLLGMMLLLIVLKFFAVTVSYSSGNAGGIFAPSLFLGSMLGGAVGTLAHMWLPNQTASPGAYALVGMGAVFAGIVRAPMTSVLMIFEMTQDYAIIVPLMIANLVSLFVASLIQKQPIYEALAVQDGIHLPSSHSRRERDQRVVQHVMSKAPDPLGADMTLAEATQIAAQQADVQTWLVSGQRGIAGVINRVWLDQERGENGDRKLADLLDPLDIPHVHADQGLDMALERMGAKRIDILPVVGRANAHHIEGIVTLHDVLEAYGVGSHELGLS
jgi:chloride channel protein, CIC family